MIDVPDHVKEDAMRAIKIDWPTVQNDNYEYDNNTIIIMGGD